MTVSSPVVSVCVQTYQHARYIEKCLDNIVEQKTNFEFEVLLGEDASTDGTREICIQYAERFPRIRLFLHDRKNVIHINGRPTGRYNFLNNLKHSTGKYIAFCEGDDYWNDPLKLQKQVDFLESNPSFALCYHNVRLATPEGEVLEKWKVDPARIAARDPNKLESRLRVPLLATMFRSQFIEYPKQFSEVFNGDTFLLGMLAQHGPSEFLGEIDDAIAHMHSSGMWTSLGSIQRFDCQIASFDSLREVIDSSWHSEIDEMIEDSYQLKLSACIKNRSPLKYVSTIAKFRAFLSRRGLPLGRSVQTHWERGIRGFFRSMRQTSGND